jgi:putative addiction module killer protein
MIEVRQTLMFQRWFAALRVDRLSLGNPGDVKAIGGGISELRLAYGPGYRLYFTQRGDTLVILLAGGDKSTQRKDIAVARRLAERV